MLSCDYAARSVYKFSSSSALCAHCLHWSRCRLLRPLSSRRVLTQSLAIACCVWCRCATIATSFLHMLVRDCCIPPHTHKHISTYTRGRRFCTLHAKGPFWCDCWMAFWLAGFVCLGMFHASATNLDVECERAVESWKRRRQKGNVRMGWAHSSPTNG